MQINSLSDIIQLIIAPIKAVLFYHKKKLLFFIFMLTLMLILLFPYSDLTFFAQNKINNLVKGSGSQISFSKLNFNFAPFGMKTENVRFSLANKSPVEIKHLFISPSLMSLLKFQPGGSLTAEGLFKGKLSLQIDLLGKNQENQKEFSMSLDLKRIDLSELFSYLQLPIKLTGQARGRLKAEGEESFRKQPQGEFSLTFNTVELPQEISTPIGTFALPKKVKWDNSNLIGNISDGKVNIETGTLGTKTSPINGRYKGQLNCPIIRIGSTIRANCNRYDMKIELELDRDFENKLAKGFSSMINPRQINKINTASGGARYLFSISGGQFGTPSLKRLKSF